MEKIVLVKLSYISTDICVHVYSIHSTIQIYTNEYFFY